MNDIAKPFLKWPGGKHRLLHILDSFFPKTIVTYNEPFLGGGAVLIHILQTHPELKVACANDINSKLISSYIAIQQQSDNLLEELSCLQKQYLALDNENRANLYYKIREEFNHLQDDGLTNRDYNTYLVEVASKLIFLNHTCFNGLYRENSKGLFNAPHGKYANPTICNETNITALHKLFDKVVFSYGSFTDALRYITSFPSQFYYLDPPYNNTFTNYAKGGFDFNQQKQLKDLCVKLDNLNIPFVQSNNYDEQIINLYNDDFYITDILAPRSINSDPTNRKPTKEIIIHNVPYRDAWHDY